MSKHSTKSFKRFLALTLTLFMLCTCMPWSQALTASADEIVVSDYDSLKDALADGGAIKLGDNITYDSTLTADENAVIDLAGYTLEYTGTDKAMTVDAAKVTLSDSSKDGTGTFRSGGQLVYATNSYVTVNSGTYTAGGTGIYAYKSNVTINGSELTSEDDAIYAEYGSTVTVNDGTLTSSSSDAIDAEYNCNVTVNNGTLDAYYYGVYLYQNGSFTMNGGTINSDEYGVYVYQNCAFTMNDGTINSEYYGVYVYQGSAFTMNDGTINAEDYGVSAYYSSTVDVVKGTVTSEDDEAFYADYNCTIN